MKSGFTTKTGKGWKNRGIKFFPRKRLSRLDAIARTVQCMNDHKFRKDWRKYGDEPF